MRVSRFSRLVLGVVAVAGSVVGVASGQVLTVDHAVQTALEKSSRIVNAHANVTDAHGGVYAALSGVTPHVSAGFWQWDYTNRPQFEGTNSLWELSFVASWNALDLSNLANVSAARQNAKAAALDVTATRNDVALAVRTQFYTVVRAIHVVRVNTEALRLSRDSERRIRALFEVGSVSKSDVLKAQVQTAQSQLDSLVAENQVTIQRISLADQMGIPERSMGDVDTSLTIAVNEYDESLLVAEGEQHRPDIQAAREALGSAKSSRMSARLSRVPSVVMTGSTFFRGSGHQSLQIDSLGTTSKLSGDYSTDPETRATIALTMNLFDGFATEARNAAAVAGLVRAQNALDVLERNLTSDVRQSLLTYRDARLSVDVAERSQESAAENLKLIQQKYNVGSATILDLIDAQVQLQRAQNQQVVARTAVNIADAGIRRAVGRPD